MTGGTGRRHRQSMACRPKPFVTRGQREYTCSNTVIYVNTLTFYVAIMASGLLSPLLSLSRATSQALPVFNGDEQDGGNNSGSGVVLISHKLSQLTSEVVKDEKDVSKEGVVDGAWERMHPDMVAAL